MSCSCSDFWTIEEVQKPWYSGRSTPSSEPFRLYVIHSCLCSVFLTRQWLPLWRAKSAIALVSNMRLQTCNASEVPVPDDGWWGSTFNGMTERTDMRSKLREILQDLRFSRRGYEECRILGCYAVWLLWEPTFRRNLVPPSSEWQESVKYVR
jgi:hypothetical protein